MKEGIPNRLRSRRKGQINDEKRQQRKMKKTKKTRMRRREEIIEKKNVVQMT